MTAAPGRSAERSPGRALHVLVTGASSGIGEELAYAYAGRGAALALVARRRPALEEVAARCRARGAALALVLDSDVTQPDQVAEAARTIAGAWPRLDRAFLNAGGGGGAASWKTIACCDDRGLTARQFSAAHAAELMQLNYGGALLWLEQLLPRMAASGGGKIAVTGSMAADGLLLASGPYMASKMAVRGLVLGLRGEAAAMGIQLTLVEPGFIDTPQTGGKRDLPFLMSSRQAGRQIAEEVERGACTIRVPWQLSLANRLARLLPRAVYAAAMARVYGRGTGEPR
jgi:NAD(P)-dependent dehydrogenase (short-subunit alcohol dehydrogenase family)